MSPEQFHDLRQRMHRHISQRQSSMSAANQRQGPVRTTSAVSAARSSAKGLRQSKCEPPSAPRAQFASPLERGFHALGVAAGRRRGGARGPIWSALPGAAGPWRYSG